MIKKAYNTPFFRKLLAGLILLYALPLSLFPAFKESDWGSRPMGMGGAFIGVASDSNAILYNPGGLAQLDKIELQFMYAKLYTGLDRVNLGMNYLALGIPLKKAGNIGIAWTNFSSLDEYQEDMFFLSYSKWVLDSTACGFNLKYFGHRYTTDERTRIDPVFESGTSKYAFTFDLGIYSFLAFDESENALSFGAVARNITQPDLGLKTVDPVPMEVGIGASFNTPASIAPALDVTYRFQEWGKTEDKISIRLGAETWFFERSLALRGGFGTSAASVGFGVCPPLWNSNLQIDYTLLWPFLVKQTQGTHQFSLTLRF